MNNIGNGALGEYHAVEFLKNKGYKILSTNAVFAGCEPGCPQGREPGGNRLDLHPRHEAILPADAG